MKLLVSTKKGLNRRRRAGIDFEPTPKVVDVDDEGAKAILTDDALNAVEVAGDYKPGDTPKLDTAAVARLELELAGAGDKIKGLTSELEDLDKAASEAVAKRDEQIAEQSKTIDGLRAKVGELEAAIAKLTPSDGSRERTASSSSSKK